MKTKAIRQRVTFKGAPHDVYELLMDSKKHSGFTGSKSRLSRKEGGKISAYDGYIEGWNVKLVPDSKIVQKWRGSDWPAGWFSTVTFKFERVPSGTKMTFVQTDVPEDQFESISEGWVENYWEKMVPALAKKKLD
jgi:activator of HSP90 ATPase